MIVSIECNRVVAIALTLWVGAFHSLFARGQELFPPVRDMYGIRSLGLGVPAVSMQGVSQGESALTNPAWVGQEGKIKQNNILRGLWFPAATLGANGTTRSLAKAYFSGQGSTQLRLENFLKAAQNEQTPFGTFAIQPGLTLGSLHWGVFGRVRVEGYVWQAPTLNPVITNDGAIAIGEGTLKNTPLVLSASDSTQMDVRATVERGTSLSLSLPYKNTGLFLGATVRPTWRSDYWGTVDLAEPLVSDSAKKLKAKFNETRGFPVDVGLAIRLPQIRMKPSLGMKIEDVSDTRFEAVSSAHQTMIQKSNMTAGLSGWLVQSPKFGSQCSVGAHHLNDARLTWNERWGLGCELHFLGQVEGDVIRGAPLIARLGGNQGGIAYGLSWDMPFAVVEIASHVARVDAPIGMAARTDRRYFLRLSVDANQQ